MASASLLLELYDDIHQLYLWSLNGFVPLSLFDDVAKIYSGYRSFLNKRL